MFSRCKINPPSYQRERCFIPFERPTEDSSSTPVSPSQCSPLVVWNNQVEQKKQLSEMAGRTGAYPSPDKHGPVQREHNVWWHCPNCSKQSYKYTNRVSRSRSSSNLLKHFVPARKKRNENANKFKGLCLLILWALSIKSTRQEPTTEKGRRFGVQL